MTDARPGLADALEVLVRVEAWGSRAPWRSRLRESRPIALECDGVSLRVAGEERVAPWRHDTVYEAAESLVARGLAPADLTDPAAPRGWLCNFCGGTGRQQNLGGCDRCDQGREPCFSCGGSCSCSPDGPRGFTGAAHSRAVLAAVASLGPSGWLRAESVARALAPRRDAVTVWHAWPRGLGEIRAKHGWQMRLRASDPPRHATTPPSPAMAEEGLGVLLFTEGPGGAFLVAEAL